MAWAGGYYVEPLYGERGVTQGEPLLPNIFNVVVEAVVSHWSYMMTEGDGDDGRDNISGDEAAQSARQTIRACHDRKKVDRGRSHAVKGAGSVILRRRQDGIFHQPSVVPDRI